MIGRCRRCQVDYSTVEAFAEHADRCRDAEAWMEVRRRASVRWPLEARQNRAGVRVTCP